MNKLLIGISILVFACSACTQNDSGEEHSKTQTAQEQSLNLPLLSIEQTTAIEKRLPETAAPSEQELYWIQPEASAAVPQVQELNQIQPEAAAAALTEEELNWIQPEGLPSTAAGSKKTLYEKVELQDEIIRQQDKVIKHLRDELKKSKSE